MVGFRILLAAMLLVLSIYTALVTLDHGLILFQVFFADMAALTWPGQFNLDFMCMLMLSGLWVSWRHRFSPAGIVLGLIAFVGGIVFLSVYLLIMSSRADGDMKQLLLGDRAS